MRRGEVCGLRWDDVDMTNRSITVRQQIVEISGDGIECEYCHSEHRQFQFGKPKTASGGTGRSTSISRPSACCWLSDSPRTPSARSGATPTRITVWCSPARTDHRYRLRASQSDSRGFAQSWGYVRSGCTICGTDRPAFSWPPMCRWRSCRSGSVIRRSRSPRTRTRICSRALGRKRRKRLPGWSLARAVTRGCVRAFVTIR